MTKARETFRYKPHTFENSLRVTTNWVGFLLASLTRSSSMFFMSNKTNEGARISIFVYISTIHRKLISNTTVSEFKLCVLLVYVFVILPYSPIINAMRSFLLILSHFFLLFHGITSFPFIIISCLPSILKRPRAPFLPLLFHAFLPPSLSSR